MHSDTMATYQMATPQRTKNPIAEVRGLKANACLEKIPVVTKHD